MSCRAAFQAISDGTWLDAPLPSGCKVADAVLAFPSLEPSPSQAVRHLGRVSYPYDVHVTDPTEPGVLIRVWLERAGDVAAVHVIRPTLPRTWIDLRDELGEPDVRIDYQSGGTAFEQWVFADRGLAMVALDDQVTLVALFPPTTADAYGERLALGSEP